MLSMNDDIMNRIPGFQITTSTFQQLSYKDIEYVTKNLECKECYGQSIVPSVHSTQTQILQYTVYFLYIIIYLLHTCALFFYLQKVSIYCTL